MEPLIIEATPKTPKVVFDPNENLYEISGRSLPENVVKTYDPVIKWIERNLAKAKGEIKFNFRMDYLNSASAKMISLILTKLEELYASGIKVNVNWFYNTDDDDIQSEGEIYQMLKKVPIKLVGVDDEEGEDDVL
ncbi:MAG TPA: DUF1987 domain-containing protein [Salinivirga sp.]|uniref:SiaC family regulatory phosphoprotein domain-containing protein n=1 Tax=Salinivirga cyanobacteriivorans TaxID=1307839 RepID=A0A0S2HZB5_9BACT|nr:MULTISPECIES: DUF1987 domain-containing protein [Salinivirga]ALO15380.1 hypothetical protein L21SP5_01738 [Salinivirga cyanobacteriivorans]HKK60616.1 DUF1987 domain-containing protein [Salinivirga sp.]